MKLINKERLYGNMLWAMSGTGYQSKALQTISVAEIIDPIHAAGGCYCKECELSHWCESERKYFCKIIDRFRHPNDFCSRGKRKENN